MFKSINTEMNFNKARAKRAHQKMGLIFLFDFVCHMCCVSWWKIDILKVKIDVCGRYNRFPAYQTFAYCVPHRRRKWGRRGRARGPNILSSCRFVAAFFFRYPSCLFYNPDIENFARSLRSGVFLNSFIINNLECCEFNNLSLIMWKVQENSCTRYSKRKEG